MLNEDLRITTAFRDIRQHIKFKKFPKVQVRNCNRTIKYNMQILKNYI